MANQYDIYRQMVQGGFRSPRNMVNYQPLTTNQMNDYRLTGILNNMPSPNRTGGSNSLGQQMAMNNQMGMANKRSTPKSPPNFRDNLLDMVLSPSGQGYAQGLLEASQYSKMPVSFGQALAQGMKRSNENLAREDLKKYREQVLGIKEDELDIKKDNLDIQRTLAEAKANTPVKANTQSYVNSAGDTMTLNLNDPKDQMLMQTDEFKNNFVEMSLQTDQKPSKISPKAKGDINTAYEGTIGLIQNINDYQTQLSDPNALTSQTLGSFVVNVDNIKTFITQGGGLFIGEKQSDLDNVSQKALNTLNKIQTNNAGLTGILRSTALQIGYDYAKANNPDGRISEKDFEYALKILMAGGVNDKDALLLNAERLKKNAVRSFNNKLTGTIAVEKLDKDEFGNLRSNIQTEYENSPFFENTTTFTDTSEQKEIIFDLDSL